MRVDFAGIDLEQPNVAFGQKRNSKLKTAELAANLTGVARTVARAVFHPRRRTRRWDHLLAGKPS
jgi:hypothetical protein